MILGWTPASQAIAIGFLQKRWGVTVFTENLEEADELMMIVKDWAVRSNSFSLSVILSRSPYFLFALFLSISSSYRARIQTHQNTHTQE